MVVDVEMSRQVGFKYRAFGRVGARLRGKKDRSLAGVGRARGVGRRGV
jgi:hypothetical protein